MEVLIAFSIIVPLILIVILIAVFVAEKEGLDKKINDFSSGNLELTPEELLKLRSFSFGGQGRPLYIRKKVISGVYVILNKTKNMYFIGHSKHVLDRVKSHLNGRGNADIYYDYKNGDSFAIKMYSLEGSGFESLRDLEKDLALKLNAISKRYSRRSN